MTNTMESIIRLLKIWKLYVSRAENCPHIERQTARCDDRIGTERQHEDHHRIQAKLHERIVERQDALGTRKVGADVAGGCGKLLLFIILAHIGFDDAHALDVFLDRIVQYIILMEYLFKQRHNLTDYPKQANSQNRDDY